MNCAITRIGKSTPFAICSCGRPWHLPTRSEKTSKQPVRAATAALPGVEGVTVHLTAMTDEERKAVHMAQLVGVPIAGVIENMAVTVQAMAFPAVETAPTLAKSTFVDW